MVTSVAKGWTRQDNDPRPLLARYQDASEQLLDELNRTLHWLLWRPDWLKTHVESLYYESRTQHAWPTEELARQSLAEAIGFARHAISVMEANPTTPRRYLDEARARLRRLQAAESKLPPPR